MKNKIKLAYGVGINDADYAVVVYGCVEGKDKIIWRCPYYVKWYSMLARCYSKKYQYKQPTYKGCSVCDEWLLFSNFRKWMENQEWEGRQLDKDFLFENNKIYSPSTCVFISHKLNNFINTRGRVRGEYPLGVSLFKGRKKNPYYSECNDGNDGGTYLGIFPTPEQAHHAWLCKKLEVCERYLIEFKEESFIVKGLMRIRDKLQYHIDTNTELTSF